MAAQALTFWANLRAFNKPIMNNSGQSLTDLVKLVNLGAAQF